MKSSDHSRILSTNISKDMSEPEASKKQKIYQKRVVAVKIDENEYDKKQKSEGPPSDCWSWRKYGQKPIKGSPYPRGYYKCSTSKSCSAKKQVERCKTDASLLIITYTSTHNHQSPKEPKEVEDPKQSEDPKEVEDTKQSEDPKHDELKIENNITEEPKEEDDKVEEAVNVQEGEAVNVQDGVSTENITEFYYCQSPFTSNSDHQDMIATIKYEEERLGSPLTEKLESVVFEEKSEEPLCCPHLMTFSTDEYDFYDELGELPISSSLTRFMRSNFSEERILIQ
ncbi:hypothetical protein DCAR_0206474 [Daucus carota subsp. sativus]|uniref:WRKY domain-containing protein n=2 Tax=Daucus carota subsp. sativus TaxID=79200 RepID=A0A169WPY3_DAUCS|nr:PREDICTED: probable WRKY transcription factor 35 [Daucus carota subsp. sativus]WOG87251.1 hypothetical protein DCAR_0206474 [Daucus carota subsp. sativus]